MNFSSFAGRMKTAGTGAQSCCHQSPARRRLAVAGRTVCVSQVFKIAEKVLTRANFVESTVRLQL